jgi:hypothetical protein
MNDTGKSYTDKGKHEKSERYILNSFQTPNAVVDELMPLLTPYEFTVLMYAIRHILGWRDRIASRKHNISVSTFENGYTAPENGEHYPGCGLGITAISKALAGLEKFGVISKAGTDQYGQVWELTYDNNKLDIAGLQERIAETAAINSKKVANARAKNPRVNLNSVPQNADHSVPQNADHSVPQNADHSVPQNADHSVPQNDSVLSHRKNLKTHQTQQTHRNTDVTANAQNKISKNSKNQEIDFAANLRAAGLNVLGGSK